MPPTRAQAFAVVGAVLMLLSGVAMAAVVANQHNENGDLNFTVSQDEDFNVTITVTNNSTPVEGANVTVEPVPPGRTYADNGTKVTDLNGTVEYAAPEDDLLVEVTVVHNNTTVSDEVVFKASDDEEEEDGENNATDAFGQDVVAFLDSLNDNQHPLGLFVSQFVLANNPGNVPAHAGPPADHPLAPAGNLSIEVTQEDGNATVNVTNETGAPVEGADVNVSAIGGGQDFDANGTTDENGTVTFELPEKPTMTTITVEFEGDSLTERVRLDGTEVGPPEDRGNGNGGNSGNAGNGPP